MSKHIQLYIYINKFAIMHLYSYAKFRTNTRICRCKSQPHQYRKQHTQDNSISTCKRAREQCVMSNNRFTTHSVKRDVCRLDILYTHTRVYNNTLIYALRPARSWMWIFACAHARRSSRHRRSRERERCVLYTKTQSRHYANRLSTWIFALKCSAHIGWLWGAFDLWSVRTVQIVFVSALL